jgi:hypothetical protein
MGVKDQCAGMYAASSGKKDSEIRGTVLVLVAFFVVKNKKLPQRHYSLNRR